MLQRIEKAKLRTKNMLSTKELKDPEIMFDSGIMTMETVILAKLAQYVKCHSGDYREYEEMLDYLVEEGVIDEESRFGYNMMLQITDFWEVNK